MTEGKRVGVGVGVGVGLQLESQLGRGCYVDQREAEREWGKLILLRG